MATNLTTNVGEIETGKVSKDLSPVEGAWAKVRADSGLAAMETRLVRVLTTPGVYDDDFLVPSADATLRAWQCLCGAALLVRAAFPKATVAADGSGGLRFEWYRREREVRLVVAVNKNDSYIYYRNGEESELQMGEEAVQLADKLHPLLEVWKIA